MRFQSSIINHQSSGSPAFTLVELIIGVTILSIASTAVFSLILITINLNTQNLYKIQALEFAREGLEAVRNIRDTNWKNNQIFSCLKAENNVCQIPSASEFQPGGNPWPKTIVISPNIETTDDPWLVNDITSANTPINPTQSVQLDSGETELWAIQEDNPDPNPPDKITTIILSAKHLPGGVEKKKIGAGFYRYVTVDKLSNNSEPKITGLPDAADLDKSAVKVTVTVAYLLNGKVKSTQLSEILTDWRKI